MRMLSLCSGIGGADLAASWANIEVVGQVEIDPFCRQVLAKHWPSVKRMGDIKDVQGNEFGEVDIIVAGFPCQPHSLAGKRQGSQDERNLWPEVKRIISTAQPRWFVGENVSGLLTVESGRFFSGILTDLVTLGYSIGWAVYGACEVGAPHRRERVFIVSHADSDRQRIWQGESECVNECPRTSDAGIDGKERSMAYTQGNDERGLRIGDETTQPGSACGGQDVAYSESRESRGIQQRGVPTNFDARSAVMEDTASPRCQEQSNPERAYNRFDPSGTGAVESGVCRGSHGLSSGLHGHQWPAGPGEPQHSWEPPRTITEKLSGRTRRLKALGNAIVPQQIYPIFQAIMESEASL